MRAGGSKEAPSEEAKRLLKDEVGFVYVCAAGAGWEELIPLPGVKTEMGGDPMLLPSRQHSRGAGSHPYSKLKENAHVLVSVSNINSLGQEVCLSEYLQRSWQNRASKLPMRQEQSG